LGINSREQRCYIPSNAHSESTLRPFSSLDDGHLTANVAARTVEDLVGVAVIGGTEAVVGVATNAVVRVSMRHVVMI
jgi:hypothetical protein